MTPQQARDRIRSFEGVDPEVRIQADRLVCRLLGESDIELAADGSITFRWNLDGVTTVARVSKDSSS